MTIIYDCDGLDACLTSPSSECLLSDMDGTERALLGAGMLENWMNWIDPDLGAASRRMKARRIGIEAAIMDMAGSAVPKILRSTVVAFCLLELSNCVDCS